ncbi:hypothetical protein [Szabonella alba]|uniref:Regulatory protein SoxS n=1 Tax=Szabonella alba TaxID=2804194 RepID=A0A8K0V6T4_9RHOB|nr:hypothetical protein [Szabonella alba]MBL4916492.1 hypothetical protein [Szabonella alba]
MLSFCLLWAALPAGAQTSDLRLYMVEQIGCIYCEMWNEQVGDAYPLTDEGRAAPLERLDLRAPMPHGVNFRSRPVFTPTFILVRDGQEIDRIEGYPGEDFFWGLLRMMLERAGAQTG